MNVAVVGLWHLGTVTAAGLAAEGHNVIAIDDATIVEGIAHGTLPVDEPHLADAIVGAMAAGRLRFGSSAESARDAQVIWFCYDTPVTDDDVPDVGFVVERIAGFLRELDMPGDAVAVVSSQLPVGTIARLEERVGSNRISFAAIPENLRLGSALAYFRSPDRFVIGVRDARAKAAIASLLSFAPNLLWMSVESAEMTKHAINAFLATSVSYANEIASLCERVGADARQVESGLKSDVRIGSKAYVRAGEAFAGGTLARDLRFLGGLGDRENLPLLQIRATAASNEGHRAWIGDRVAEAICDIEQPAIAFLGLTYKPWTDTLRASTAMNLARRLSTSGACLSAYDPAIRPGDARLSGIINATSDAAQALHGADVAVIATPWPQFREIPLAAFASMRHLVVVDAARFLEDRLAVAPGVRYLGFGRGVPRAIP